MSAATLLTEELLEALAERLRAQRAPVVDVLRPGLSEAEMQARVEPLGLRLPREARVWWGWHDGASDEAGMIGTYVGPGICVCSLAEAVESCVQAPEIEAEAREIERAAGEIREDWWRHDWLPLVNPTGGEFAMATGGGDADPVPVHRFYFDAPSRSPDAASLGELVSIWIGSLDSGAWRFDADEGRWFIRHDLLDPRVAKIGLA